MSEVQPGPRPRQGLGNALKWSAVMNVGRQVGNLVVTFVLAAILGPTAYGVVALALIYVMFVQLLMQLGLGSALIQRRELTSAHLSSAFWVIGLASLVLSACSILLSGWWAHVNGTPELQAVTVGLTPILIIRGLMVVPDAQLRRAMRFKALAVRTNAAVLAGGVVGIGVAVAGGGVWALVAQQLTMAGVEAVVVWVAARWRPDPRLDVSAIRELLPFATRSAVAGFGVFANGRMDALLIGLNLGPTAVGLYRFATRLVDTVLESISGSLQAVSLPELARWQDDPSRFLERTKLLYRTTSAACFVPLAALAAGGPWVVRSLGDDWAPAASAVAVIAVAGIGRVVGQLVGPVLQALGRPGVLAILTWGGAAVSAAAYVTATHLARDASLTNQVLTLAVTAAALHSLVFQAMNFWIVARATGSTVRSLAGTTVPGCIAGASGFAVGRPLGYLTDLAGAPQLVAAGVSGTASVVVSGLLLLRVAPDLMRSLGRALRRT